jgi:hypothetical protein
MMRASGVCGDVEHGVDETQEVLAVGANAGEGIERFRSLRLVEAFLDELGIPENGRERCPQLVAHIGTLLIANLTSFASAAAPGWVRDDTGEAKVERLVGLISWSPASLISRHSALTSLVNSSLYLSPSDLTLTNTYQRSFLSNIRSDKVEEGSIGVYAESTLRWTP